MFRSAALKLTLWYLAIIMAISFVFSLSLYHVSSNDLSQNVNRQIAYFKNSLVPDDAYSYRVLRQRQLNDDLEHLKRNLILFNLMVLAFGGAASYWLSRRTLAPIEEALKSQSRFASDASHELRTPLTAIQTENEVALRNKSLTQAQAIDIIKSNLEEVAKLKSLSEGLLSLARQGGYIENPEPILLKNIVNKAADRHELAAKAKKINIIASVGKLKVLGEESSLVQLLSIFLDNAIKYSPSKATVRITAKKQKQSIALKISDRGAGIAREELPHIFERFYRADNSRSRSSSGGYGLGLAIARKIADSHHGHIEVSSTVGAGTTFTVFLPASM
jgi:two-component system sensor histidine kinase CiaH